MSFISDGFVKARRPMLLSAAHHLSTICKGEDTKGLKHLYEHMYVYVRMYIYIHE